MRRLFAHDCLSCCPVALAGTVIVRSRPLTRSISLTMVSLILLRCFAPRLVLRFLFVIFFLLAAFGRLGVVLGLGPGAVRVLIVGSLAALARRVFLWLRAFLLSRYSAVRSITLLAASGVCAAIHLWARLARSVMLCQETP